MNDRPIQQMSLRAFRDSVAELRQPVEVSKRGPDGLIRVLGSWTPYKTEPIANLDLTEDQDQVPGGTTAIRGGQYVREDRAPLDLPTDDDHGPKVINSPDDVPAVVEMHPVRAVPKPSQRRRR